MKPKVIVNYIAKYKPFVHSSTTITTKINSVTKTGKINPISLIPILPSPLLSID
jgi:hypothetical protein